MVLLYYIWVERSKWNVDGDVDVDGKWIVDEADCTVLQYIQSTTELERPEKALATRLVAILCEYKNRVTQ